MEEFGKGDTHVELSVSSAARYELLRLSLKKNSEVAHHDDGSITLTLYVDRWEWLIPLVTSYGPDGTVIGPHELRQAIAAHLTAALAAYDMPQPPAPHIPAQAAEYDARLRSTHGRPLWSPRSDHPPPRTCRHPPAARHRRPLRHRDQLRTHMIASYGLTEDVTGFTRHWRSKSRPCASP
ncbi:WYL domain-containing protein [Streptomyces sp. NPDC051130]|uniref:WYL domain-containing protein n=1 Tax=Streptomyces sp. NPDC051130 TaxID=3157223 RepID=UPI00343F442D